MYFKDVHNTAVISSNICDEQRISLLPFSGHADDIALVSLFEKVLKSMLETLIEKTQESKLCIKPDKCAILYERRSGNRWYKAKGDKPPEIKIHGEKNQGTTPTRAIHISGKAVNCRRGR